MANQGAEICRMIDHEMQQATHSTFWWNVKVLCGSALILLVCERYLIGYLTQLTQIQTLIGQSLVVIGGALFLFHYYLNRSANRKITTPIELVRDKGLYRFVRHPMYSADVIIYAGFCALAPTLFSIGVFSIAVLALYRQSREEDRFLAQRFPDDHTRWREKTGLMLPRI